MKETKQKKKTLIRAFLKKEAIFWKRSWKLRKKLFYVGILMGVPFHYLFALMHFGFELYHFIRSKISRKKETREAYKEQFKINLEKLYSYENSSIQEARTI